MKHATEGAERVSHARPRHAMTSGRVNVALFYAISFAVIVYGDLPSAQAAPVELVCRSAGSDINWVTNVDLDARTLVDVYRGVQGSITQLTDQEIIADGSYAGSHYHYVIDRVTLDVVFTVNSTGSFVEHCTKAQKQL